MVFVICLPQQKAGARPSHPAHSTEYGKAGPQEASAWPLSPLQAELMSSLIEYCIELNQTSEPAAPQENVSGPPAAAGSPPPPAQRPPLRRQGSVVCSRLQHLSTIDYVEEGEHARARHGGPRDRAAEQFRRQRVRVQLAGT